MVAVNEYDHSVTSEILLTFVLQVDSKQKTVAGKLTDSD